MPAVVPEAGAGTSVDRWAEPGTLPQAAREAPAGCMGCMYIVEGGPAFGIMSGAAGHPGGTPPTLHSSTPPA